MNTRTSVSVHKGTHFFMSVMNTRTKPDLFELIKSLKRSGFLYAKRDYPHDKTDINAFS